MNKKLNLILLLLALYCFPAFVAQAQSSAFTYQGRFTDSTVAQPTNGTYDMQFALYDSSNVQQPLPTPVTITNNSVVVTNGVFTVPLDFGASSFVSGADRFLEIRVFSTATSGYVTLTPRQQLTSSPFSIRTISASAADSLSNLCVSCVDDAKIDTISGSKVTGTVANATAADTATTATSATSFSGSLGGDVTGTENATVVSKVGGQTASSVATATTTINGATNTNTGNAIVKRDASGNFSAGTISATTFNGNATSADTATTATTATNFSGSLGGDVTGSQSATVVSKVGGQTASSVATATTTINSATNTNTGNAIVKRDASGNFSAGTISATTFNGNATSADTATTATTATNFSGSLGGDVTGTQSATVVSKVGGQTASSVASATTAANLATSLSTANTIVKRDANGNFSAGTITASLSGNATSATNATQLGGVAANQYVQTGDARLSDARSPTAFSSNYIWNATSQQTADFNISGNGKAGGTLTGNIINASTQYNLDGDRVLSAGGIQNLFAGVGAGSGNSGIGNTLLGFEAGKVSTSASFNAFVGTKAGTNNNADYNSFFGSAAGSHNTNGDSNSFVGASAGALNTTGTENSFFGALAGFNSKTGHHNTAIGSGADFGAVNLDYATAIGADSNVSTSNTIVLGRNDGSDKVRIFGLGSAGSDHLCRNSNYEISSCSSSLRYKTNIAPFNFGLNLINQLQPITFDWKTGGMKDVGFGAEDVARVNPLFVTYNAKGEVEGVKYDRLGAVFVNAIKEQQTQIQQEQREIQTQRKKLKTQQEQIEALRKLVCLDHPNAPVCK